MAWVKKKKKNTYTHNHNIFTYPAMTKEGQELRVLKKPDRYIAKSKKKKTCFRNDIHLVTLGLNTSSAESCKKKTPFPESNLVIP